MIDIDRLWFHSVIQTGDLPSYRYRCHRCLSLLAQKFGVRPLFMSFFIAVAIWPVTGQGVENTKWPEVLYSQQISQNRKILANHNYHMSI